MDDLSLDCEFDATEIDTSDMGVDILPKGEYRVMATELTPKKTQRGDGVYVSGKFEVIEGRFQNWKLFKNFNHTNPNEEAQKRGRQELANLNEAVFGEKRKASLDSLLNRPIIAIVRHRKDKNDGEMRAQISSFRNDDGGGLINPEAAKTTSKPATKKSAPKVDEDDDLPF